MADFCGQCTRDTLGVGDGSQNDFVGSTTSAQEAEGLAYLVLCEGCGIIRVDRNGFCTSSYCDKGGHNETA